ncbi:hypothetical protein, partial [Xenorhabdus cabanillasii]|uniref:hypothetical protein n=1 Tax=Xenorhabdus cabanillasii TaxID=351673 RepID=UPI00056EDA5D
NRNDRRIGKPPNSGELDTKKPRGCEAWNYYRLLIRRNQHAVVAELNCGPAYLSYAVGWNR